MQTVTNFSMGNEVAEVVRSPIFAHGLNLHEERELPEDPYQDAPPSNCEMFEGGLGI